MAQNLNELTNVEGYLRAIINTKYPVLKTDKMKRSLTLDIKSRTTSLLYYILKNPIHCSYKIWKLFEYGDITKLDFLKIDEFKVIGNTQFLDINSVLPLHELESDY